MNPRLHAALQAWGRSDFAQVLCDELQRQDALFAPLQRAIEHGSQALVDRAVPMLLHGAQDADTLQVDVAISYSSITPGCACEADPTPMSKLPEFATLRIRIRRDTAEATLRVLDN